MKGQERGRTMRNGKRRTLVFAAVAAVAATAAFVIYNTDRSTERTGRGPDYGERAGERTEPNPRSRPEAQPEGEFESVTVRDVTWIFDRALPIWFSPLGDPMVVSSQEFSIVSISPASRGIEGRTPDGEVEELDAHGTMINPSREPAEQGFDQIADITGASGQTVARYRYNPALNVDPGKTGRPIEISSGWTGSIVKSVRRDGVKNVGPWHIIEDYVVLSVLDTPPPPGAFRPPAPGDEKPVIATVDDVDFNVLQNIDTSRLPRIGPDTRGGHARIKPTLPLWRL